MKKKDRSTTEKIDDCLDNHVQNLTAEKRTEMYEMLLKEPTIARYVRESKKYVVHKMNLPTNGKNTRIYWLKRGGRK